MLTLIEQLGVKAGYSSQDSGIFGSLILVAGIAGDFASGVRPEEMSTELMMFSGCWKAPRVVQDNTVLILSSIQSWLYCIHYTDQHTRYAYCSRNRRLLDWILGQFGSTK